jgi:hypothetical protein
MGGPGVNRRGAGPATMKMFAEDPLVEIQLPAPQARGTLPDR